MKIPCYLLLYSLLKYNRMEHVRKERSKNFTRGERALLIKLVQKRSKIIENKVINNITIKEKEDCWEDLLKEFISRSKGVVRTVQSLKTCWENLKKRTRRQYAKEEQTMYKTDAGEYTAIEPTVEGFSNTFDSDCTLEFQNDCDSDEEFVEEWLQETSVAEDVTEKNESDMEDDECDNEEDSGSDEFNMDANEVLNFLEKDKLNRNPRKLETQIGTILNTSKRKSTFSLQDCLIGISNQNKRLKENVSVSSKLMETVTEKNNQVKEDNSNNVLAKFGTLADSKINLVNIMIEKLAQKHELEIEVLKMQLQKEKLQVGLMEKDLELKTLNLEMKKQRLDNNML